MELAVATFLEKSALITLCQRRIKPGLQIPPAPIVSLLGSYLANRLNKRKKATSPLKVGTIEFDNVINALKFELDEKGGHCNE
jgi:hypothetical protein